jgi:CO/xanthine dehydrogenase Mo-binding subunit
MCSAAGGTVEGGLVGSSQRRLEGASKTRGGVLFTGDLRLPGTAHARLVLAPEAPGKVVSVGLERARRAAGVLLAVAAADLPRLAGGDFEQALATGRVAYAGQPVAVVVAETRAAAADAASLVDVEIEREAGVFDVLEAMRPEAPVVLPELVAAAEAEREHGTAAGHEQVEVRPRNCTAAVRYRQGDAAAALRDSAFTAGGRYVVPGVHQSPMEPHVSTARPEPDGTVTLWTSTQGAFTIRDRTARVLGWEPGRLRVMPVGVGGGFGAKLSPLTEPLAVLLALRLGRPVELALTRTEEFLMGRASPGTVVDLELGADDSGRLTAVRATLYFDTGAGRSGLGANAALSIASTYRVPACDVTAFDVATNKAPVFAYRAPGQPQAFFALESALDELSEKLGRDPLELRMENASREGDPRPDGTVWPRIGLVECLERARAHPVYTDPLAEGERIGVAAGCVRGGRQPAAAGCRLDSDGSLVLQLGAVDVTGSDTALAMLAADAFGTSLERVRVESSDTVASPYNGAAAGSKVVYTVGPAVIEAASEARRQLLEIAAEVLEADVGDLVLERGEVWVKGVPGRSVSAATLAALTMDYDSPHRPVHGLGRSALSELAPMLTVHVARAVLDRDTGEYRITRYLAVQDVGRAINPAEIEGQVHGGALQGLGRALGEQVVYDGSGALLTASFLDYALPTVDQAPPVEVELVEVPSPFGPLGARGVGEPPVVPGAAALAAALSRAAGRRIRRLPISPEALAAPTVAAAAS